MMSHKNILITGGAGFIGSNFIPYFIHKYPSRTIINLDKLTYAGNLANLKEIEAHENYHFIKGDICDTELVNDVFEKHNIQSVIHFAAESHVDNSIEAPDHFIKTNIEGTFVLLETARKHWINNTDSTLNSFEKRRFHHISTDEVFGSLSDKGFFSESTPYAPNSPYSASKAASDFLVRSYFHTYGLNVVTSNCSNNYGPKQHNEKLIPTIIRNAVSGKPIPIYGDGKNVRDWLYVMDHCKGIDLVFHKGRPGETYVMGGGNEHNNLYVANAVCEALDKVKLKTKGSYKQQITYVKDRKGHDFRYAIDSAKIRTELGWKPEEKFVSGLRKTIEWYIDKYQKPLS